MARSEDRRDVTLAYYTQHAQEYAARTNAIDHSPVYARFEPLLPAGAVILDLGCGGGRDTRHFASAGHRVIAMDPCPALLDEARRRTPPEVGDRICYVVGAAPGLPFANSTVSAIWASASLLHLPRPTMPETLAECRRIMLPGGILSVSVKQGTGEGLEDGRRVTYWDADELVLCINGAGLETVTADLLPSLDRRPVTWIHVVARKPKTAT